MYGFDPPLSLTVAFTALTLIVVGADVALVRRAAPEAQRGRWTRRALIAAGCWLGLHAGLALSGVLEAQTTPPPVMPFLFVTLGVGAWVGCSRVGRQFATLPVVMLVALQAFRLPLEWILHALHASGDLPVQMTWSGYNLDVIVGASGLLIGLLYRARPLPDWLAWAWNVMGSLLLLNVMTIAVLSAPLPIRQFLNDPPVVMPFHVPYTWIVSVHVWTALVSHIVIFRALARRRRERAMGARSA